MLENRKIYGKILALMLAIFAVLQMATSPVFAADHKVTFHKSDGTELKVEFESPDEKIGGGGTTEESHGIAAAPSPKSIL